VVVNYEKITTTTFEKTTILVIVKKVSMAMIGLIMTTSYKNPFCEPCGPLIHFIETFSVACSYIHFIAGQEYNKRLHIHIHHSQEHWSKYSSIPNSSYGLHLQPCMSKNKNTAADQVVFLLISHLMQ
jgi:hypothetical protein